MDSRDTVVTMTNPYDSVPNPMAPQQPPQQRPAHPEQAFRPQGQQDWQRWQAPSTPQASAPAAPSGYAHPSYSAPADAAPTHSAPVYSNGAYPLAGSSASAQTAVAAKPRRRTGLVFGTLLAAVLVGIPAGFGGAALWDAQQPQTQSARETGGATGEPVTNPGTIADVAAQAGPSVVTVQASSNAGSGEGSGVAVAAGGYIVTNNHVVTLGGQSANASITVETNDGRLLAAEVVGTDPIVDLAVIKVDADLPVITFASSDDVRVGDSAIAIGAPLGLSNSVTDGIVSAVDRGLRIASSAAPQSGDEQQSDQSPFGFWQPDGAQAAQQEISIPVVQTDASINPGNSGGALLNSGGQLVGINVAIASMGSTDGESAGSIGIGFAIQSSLVQRVVEEIIATGEATHGLLGASVSDVTDASVGTVGAQIQELSDGGAAEAAGLRVGDVVTEIAGQPVTGAVDATAQVRSHAAGSDVTVTYVRDGETAEVQVTLGALS
ncbi:trypsin-like peptidase domain-containing protein [Agrococcus sp. ProA11]|uniref:S1C family serine protease n=1 Tax=Agrococcus chionoecetis TaxID=3153752 RepID=UPI003260F759